MNEFEEILDHYSESYNTQKLLIFKNYKKSP